MRWARNPAGPELRARLEQLEQRANHMHVPQAFAHMAYTLRMHIGLVRKRITAEGSST